MTPIPMFPGFDGLMTLSRREGVDIRPTLLRVLTDLYVQTSTHTADEERQFVALTSRLIDEVDDATRAAIRARLSIYSGTPKLIADKLELIPVDPSSTPLAPPIEPLPAPVTETVREVGAPAAPRPQNLTMQPKDATEISGMFFAADSAERVMILRSLEAAPLRAAPRVDAGRAGRSIASLERMALEADMLGFAEELARILILPTRLARQIVEDPNGEPLACAARALGMSTEIFERVVLFLDPELGASVNRVYRLSRLYDTLGERVTLILLAAWRGTSLAATQARHQPVLHEDERQRARAAAQAGSVRAPTLQPTLRPATRLPSKG